MAPDAGSAKSARELATARKWVTTGKSDNALWGECQGSGALPYQTAIDASEPAFKCSCPSRKFPCKHGLGLMLLYASAPTAILAGNPPDWVSAWISGRAAKLERKVKPAEDPTSTAAANPIPAKPQKSVAARESKVLAGIEELDLWLRDLVKGGIAELTTKPKSYWSDRTARLIDAQAPGLARMVTEIGRATSSGAGWQSRTLELVGLLYLLIEGYRRQDSLPPELREDVRSLTGWNQLQEQVLASPGVRDRWLVVGQRTVQEDHLTIQRTWLWGEEQRQPALILNFAAPRQPLQATIPVGNEFDGEFCFFESASPLRALIRERKTVAMNREKAPDFWTISDAANWRSQQLACSPWLDVTPYLLSGVHVSRDESGKWMAHHGGDASPSLTVSPLVDQISMWRLTAIAGGAPSSICCEWDGMSLVPLSVWSGGRMVPL